MFLSKYGVARHIYIPVVKRAVVDFAVSADWTPAAGDVKISKDGGAAANVTNLPTAIAMGNGAIWDFSLTATEMQAAQVIVTVADSATKAVEDQSFIIETYGNASGQHAVDLSDSVRAGLTALPNAAAAASGGLIINGSNAGTVTIGDGLVVNRSSANSDAVSFAASGTGHGLKVRSGNGATGNGLDVAALSTNGHAANLAGAGTGDGFKTAGGTTGHGIDAIGGSAAAAGDGIKGSVLGTGAPIRGDLTGNITGNLSGSAGSVTGAVGSVTARVTANVDQVDGAALTAHAAGKVPADVLTIAGTAQTARDIGASVIVATNNDKTGYALTAAYDAAKTASQAGDQMSLVAAVRPGIRKNTALAAFEFLMTDSTNHLPLTGATVAVVRSIDGGAFAAGTLGAVTELSNGIYKFTWGAADLNGDVITLRASATGADDLFVTIRTTP